jgi:hypothetical protein
MQASVVHVTFEHAKMTDPEFDEIDRILLILQNEDGSWGTAESLDERLYPTAWVMHALSSQGFVDQLKGAMNLLRNNIVRELEDEFLMANYMHTRKLCGLIAVFPFISRDKLWHSKPKLIANFKQILEFIKSRNWLNSQVASYIAYFLQKTELSQYAQEAIQMLDATSVIKPDPFAVLVSEKYLDRVLKDTVLINSLDKLPDEELAHLLVAFAIWRKANKLDQALLEAAKRQVITIIQKRHLTELDKKISKEILDTLLLLRAGVDKREMQNRLKKLGSSLYLSDIEFSDSTIKLTTEIPSKGLLDILGRIDLIVLSTYVLAINDLGEKVVHLVPERDYKKVASYFKTPTLPVPTRRVITYESSLPAH